MFKEIFATELNLIEQYLHEQLDGPFSCPRPELEEFWQSMKYSLFTEGKRFRPLLSVLTAQALNRPMEQALPLGAAVEMIHTYSLIHDDLPVMDNDDFRRGQPTNHKVYGDAQALLAGDALLTMAFGVLAQSDSKALGAVVRRLSQAAGAHGMVGGQVLDIAAYDPTEEQLEQIHARKTGALIAVAVEGAALLLEASDQEVQAFAEFGRHLGMAFQIADDLQDFNPQKPEKVNYATRMGVDATRTLLDQVSKRAVQSLAAYGDKAQGLRRMIELNSKRV